MRPGRRGFAATAALALALGLSGCAAEPPPESASPEDREDDASRSPRTPALRALDSDDSGDLSAEEIDAAAASLAALDADGDGRLSGAELRPRPRTFAGSPGDLPEGAHVFTLDADGDGAVDIADLPPQIREFLAPADADGDGTASTADIIGLVAARAGEPGEGAEDPDGREAPGAGGDDAPPLGFGPLAATLDTDGDGAVSEAELASAARSLRLLDRDSDGRLSPDELRPE